jgi:hypothetical protein
MIYEISQALTSI